MVEVKREGGNNTTARIWSILELHTSIYTNQYLLSLWYSVGLFKLMYNGVQSRQSSPGA